MRRALLDGTLASLRCCAPGTAILDPRRRGYGCEAVESDAGKVDEAVLARMYLTAHDGCRAWKTFDWEATDRLYRNGFIENPVNKTQSIVLTERGLAEAERLFLKLFVQR